MKNIFKNLPKETQNKIMHTLTAYDLCIVDFYDNEYKTSPDICMMLKRPADFKHVAVFYARDFFENTGWYLDAWQEFCDRRHQDKTLKTSDFNAWADRQCNAAIEKYIK